MQLWILAIYLSFGLHVDHEIVLGRLFSEIPGISFWVNIEQYERMKVKYVTAWLS